MGQHRPAVCAVFLFALSGCGPGSGDAGSPTKAARCPQNLIFDVATSVRDSGLAVTVRTNLPDGAKVNASLDSPVYGLGRAQSEGAVADSQVALGPFSLRGAPLPPGRYELSVSAPSVPAQPVSVRAALGPDYGCYKSDLVEEVDGGTATFGAFISKELVVNVPGK